MFSLALSLGLNVARSRCVSDHVVRAVRLGYSDTSPKCIDREGLGRRRTRPAPKAREKRPGDEVERNAFSLQPKETVLVAFRISKLRELKNLGPWKLMEKFLILVLHCGK